jgi:hypothetical protein
MGMGTVETKFVENLLFFRLSFLFADELMGSEICISAQSIVSFAKIYGDVISGVRMSVIVSCVYVGCTPTVCILVT